MPSSPFFVLLGLILGVAAAGGSESTCSNFTLVDIPNVDLTAATYFAANALVNISNAYSSIDESNLPAFCRVELVITTNATAGSSALTEVWLPDDWNGRVLTVGNGGMAGGGRSSPVPPLLSNEATEFLRQ